MNLFKKINPVWALRLSFGIMYLYSGSDLIQNPKAWTWALPFWFKQLIARFTPVETFLKFHGTVEILLALALMAWFLKPSIVKIVAAVSALEMASILFLAFVPWSETNFLITFRDIGLFGGAITLLALLVQREHEHE